MREREREREGERSCINRRNDLENLGERNDEIEIPDN